MRIFVLLMSLLTAKGFLYILKFVIKSKINGACMNTILLIGNKHQNSQTFFDNAKKTISAFENGYVSFDFRCVDLSDKNIIEKAKTAHAILFYSNDKQENAAVDSIRKNLGLYAQISTFSSYNDGLNHAFSIVQDKGGGIYDGEKGFLNNSSFGREAYDTESYSELEIERVSRVAYELANDSRRKLVLADKADKLTTSKLWRKIVADVNEDYPFVSVDMQDVTDVLKTIIKNPTTLDVVLSTSLFGDMLAAVAKAMSDNAPSVSFVGDTPLAMYGFSPSGQKATTADSINNLVSFMMKNSFGIE